MTASIGRGARMIGVDPIDEPLLRELSELILDARRRRSETCCQQRSNRILPVLDELAMAGALWPR